MKSVSKKAGHNKLIAMKSGEKKIQDQKYPNKFLVMFCLHFVSQCIFLAQNTDAGEISST